MKDKIISINRKAKHDYFIEEEYECGIVLKGTEIKSIRAGSVNLKDAYISFIDNEAYIKGMHIAPYKNGNIFNHDELRERKLLLHKKEILKLQKEVKIKGYTIIPLNLKLVRSRAKLTIALAKGKHLYDKRNSEKEKDAKRAMAKMLKRY